jgi:hypothetical protein
VHYTSFTLTGPVTGNAFFVQGTFEEQAVSYNGYYELTYDSLTNANDIPSLYFEMSHVAPPTLRAAGTSSRFPKRRSTLLQIPASDSGIMEQTLNPDEATGR